MWTSRIIKPLTSSSLNSLIKHPQNINLHSKLLTRTGRNLNSYEIDAQNNYLHQKMISGFFHRSGSAKDLDEIQKAKQEALRELNITQPLQTPPNKESTTNSPSPSSPPPLENSEKLEDNFFVEKMRLMEEKERLESEKSYGFFKLPLLLLSATLYIYYQWENTPFSEVFKHATISEYIPREQYYHSIFTGALSMMNEGSLIIYGPVMAYSLYLCSRVMKQRHIALLFATNALLTCAVTFYYERSKVQPGGTNMVTPKAHGAVTPLAFMSAFLGISPNYCLFRIRLLPFFLIPAFYFMYECYEYSSVYVNEVSRPAHISAMVYGLFFGVLCKRFVL